MSDHPYTGPEDCYALTPMQQKVVALLSAGSTIAAAAQAAGVHRNTVATWRRQPAIRAALTHATQNLCLHPAHVLTLLKTAVAILERHAPANSPTPPTPGETVRSVPNPAQPAPPAQKIDGTNPILPPPGEIVHPAHDPAQSNPSACANDLETLATTSPKSPTPCETVHPMHNPAQPEPKIGFAFSRAPSPADVAQARVPSGSPAEPRADSALSPDRKIPTPCETVHPMHNPAQPPQTEQTNPISPVTRPPKVGRNQPCPCGSGKKFKRCCMPVPHPGCLSPPASSAAPMRSFAVAGERPHNTTAGR